MGNWVKIPCIRWFEINLFCVFSELICSVCFQILVQGVNPGVSYRYTLPKASTYPVIHNYTWTAKLSDCDQPCAGGK